MLPLGFASPFILAALLALPALWWLLRITPPRPRQIHFPPLRLILDLKPKEEQPSTSPLWLLILRVLTAAAIILAMAGPIWNPAPSVESGKGPLLILMDDGWAAAPSWEQRAAYAAARIQSAGRDNRPVAIHAASDGGRDILSVDAQKALERLRALKPQPHQPDRMALLAPIETFLKARPEASLLWMSDGLAANDARRFAERLSALTNGALQVAVEDRPARALAAPDNATGALTVRVMRAGTSGETRGTLRAVDLKGLTLGETAFDFAGTAETTAKFDMPVELRNEIARIEIASEKSAGAVALLDDRWKRRRVAIVSGASADVSQPLLAPTYYLTRALGPFADAREQRGEPGQAILAALEDKAPIVVLADVGMVAGEAHDRLARFVEEGGVLLRFAGVRLAGSSDDLVPVRLRRGGRVLGGSLSWDQPKKLAPFERESPFFGLTVPSEVTAMRQVLAEPDVGLAQKTWAALADGTPLVTAARRGKGLVVLVHVTADTTWSNLPLSGLFVDMLKRIVAMSGQTGTETLDPTQKQEQVETASPTRTLDGFGAFGAPPVSARPIPVNYAGHATPDHPPGFYGPLEALVAVNTLGPGERIAPVDLSGIAMTRDSLQRAEPVDLRALFIVLAALGLIADALASVWLAGGLSRGARKAAAAALVAAFALACFATPDGALAQQAQQGERKPATKREIDAALKTRLAYVVTGDARTDETSRAGLTTLSRTLGQRTSLLPGDPVGVDPARDELAFYPLIYWPIVPSAPQPSPEAVTRIANFMKQGGTILFDTRDAMTARPDGPPSPEARWLRALLAGVDVPELEPVPRDHVVTKTFYLLDNFVGRTTIGQTWIEALPPDRGDPASRPARAGDSVSPIVLTSNDLAAAWATTASGDAMFPLIPGDARQREMALRGGINLVMYTLTGNYKADQVHVKDLLERLGL